MIGERGMQEKGKVQRDNRLAPAYSVMSAMTHGLPRSSLGLKCGFLCVCNSHLTLLQVFPYGRSLKLIVTNL